VDVEGVCVSFFDSLLIPCIPLPQLIDEGRMVSTEGEGDMVIGKSVCTFIMFPIPFDPFPISVDVGK
jgi:hypothetical protein